MSSLSSIIFSESEKEEALNKLISNGNNPIKTSYFDNVNLYKNKYQATVAIDIINFLNNLVTRDTEPFENKDCCQGALVAATKFAVQTYYQNNKRNFTKEHKKEILDFVSKIIDAQIKSTSLQQAFAR